MSTTLNEDEQKLVDVIVKHSKISQYGAFTIQVVSSRITITAMYSNPIEKEFAFLSELSEIYKTKDINVGQENRPGCDTCDHGSAYGITVHLNNPKNFENIRQLLVSTDDRELRWSYNEAVTILMTGTFKNYELTSTTFEPYIKE